MNEEVEKIRKYLKIKGVDATEEEIIGAAIRIARRVGGDWAFACELEEGEHKSSEKWRQ